MRRFVLLVLVLVGVLSTMVEPAGATGDDWDPPTVLAEYDNGFIVGGSLRLTSNATGHVFATWRHHGGGADVGVAAVRDPASGAWSTARTLFEPDFRVDVGAPEVLVLPDGRGVVVAATERRVGVQEINTDGTLGRSRIGRLPVALGAAQRFYPNVTSDGDVAVAVIGWQDSQLAVMHSRHRPDGPGRWREIDVPPPDVPADARLNAVTIDDELNVAAVVDHSRAPMSVTALELVDGAWVSQALPPQARSSAAVARGPDGAAAVLWRAKEKVMVATRIDGAWSIDAVDRSERCGRKIVDCGVVGIGPDGDVVATWMDHQVGESWVPVISRRNPATGSWSPPEPFAAASTWNGPRWSLRVGHEGEAIMWWPPSVAQLVWCERDAACETRTALRPDRFRDYSDTLGADLVTAYPDGLTVKASTDRQD